MNPENIYRFTGLVLLLTAMSISITFRHRAAQSKEPIKSEAEGRVILTLRSVFGLLGWLSAFLYLINPGWMAWAQLPLPSWLRWTGAAIMAICIPFIYWVFSSLGKNVTPTVVTPRGTYIGHPRSLSLGQTPALYGWIPGIYRV